MLYCNLQNAALGVYTFPKRTLNEEPRLIYGHCVRMIGWGYDSHLLSDYYLFSNSWGRAFGEHGLSSGWFTHASVLGFFRMKIDVSSRDSMGEVFAGLPQL